MRCRARNSCALPQLVQPFRWYRQSIRMLIPPEGRWSGALFYHRRPWFAFAMNDSRVTMFTDAVPLKYFCRPPLV